MSAVAEQSDETAATRMCPDKVCAATEPRSCKYPGWMLCGHQGDGTGAMRGEDVRVGDVILSGQQEWTVTGISDPIPHDRNGMFMFFVTPERHKPIHTNPDSTWRVRRPILPGVSL